ATISGISSVDSKLFHFQIFESRDITLDSIRISAPGDSPNTDGIHIADSTNIQVTNSVIGTVMTASPSPRLHQFDHLKCSMRSLAMASADLAKMLMRKMSTVWRILLSLRSRTSSSETSQDLSPLQAIKLVCSKAAPCEGVELNDIIFTCNGDEQAKNMTSTCVHVTVAPMAM
ncbi:Glycosyl hydrolases family 28, partial [Musa troglodytarum]